MSGDKAETLRILEEDIDVLSQARARLEQLSSDRMAGNGYYDRAYAATLIARVLDDLAAERRRLMESLARSEAQ